MPPITFAIIIPAHNGDQFIRYAIASAIHQTRVADEIIVADDASTDRTAAIAQSREWRGNIQYFYHDKSRGFVDAWDRAVKIATADFVAILHQDDILYPEYLDNIEKAIQRFPAARHFYAACDYVDEAGGIIKTPPGPYSSVPVLYSGKQYAHNYLQGMITNNHIHRCPGVTTSRGLLLNECTYREEAGHIADDDFFLRVGAYTDVVGISHPLAGYRHHTSSLTSKLNLLSLKLACDYVFQVRFHRGNGTLLVDGDVMQLQLQAVKFINLLLFQSLLYKQQAWTNKALALRDELDLILPSFMEKSLPLWARQLWRMTCGEGSRNRPAAFYAAILNAGIKSRNFLRSMKEEYKRLI
jgi:glycosyltransferase involved in cell wall biosynthesis